MEENRLDNTLMLTKNIKNNVARDSATQTIFYVSIVIEHCVTFYTF